MYSVFAIVLLIPFVPASKCRPPLTQHLYLQSTSPTQSARYTFSTVDRCWQEAMPLGFISGEGGNSPEDLFRSLPPISKGLITGMVLAVFTVTLGIFAPIHFALAWPLVWKNFHVWRLISCGIYPGPPEFQTLFTIFSIGMYSVRCEIYCHSRAAGCLASCR